MARFTVADCMETINNRFDMTIAAALRARQIEKGSDIMVEHEEGDKPTVIALREIADHKVDQQILGRVEQLLIKQRGTNGNQSRRISKTCR